MTPPAQNACEHTHTFFSVIHYAIKGGCDIFIYGNLTVLTENIIILIAWCSFTFPKTYKKSYQLMGSKEKLWYLHNDIYSDCNSTTNCTVFQECLYMM